MEKILYNAMLSKIQKDIKNHKEEFDKLKEIDLKHCKIKVEIGNLLEIIENYKKVEISDRRKAIFVYCNGNPYIVLNLAIIGILNNISIKINIDDCMLGVNRYILEIINNVSKANNLKTKMELGIEAKGEKIICIDRVNEYNILKKDYEHIKYIPYQSLDIYSDSEEFEGLFEKVYNYGIDMNIDIDIFDEEGIEGLFKYGKGKNKLILTKNNDVITKYKKENIYINENPFREEKIIFGENIIKEIIK